jgi:hypothetical protein
MNLLAASVELAGLLRVGTLLHMVLLLIVEELLML